MEYEAIEILKDGLSIGYSPIFYPKGKKPTMILGEDGLPLIFATPKEARKSAYDHIIAFKVR